MPVDSYIGEQPRTEYINGKIHQIKQNNLEKKLNYLKFFHAKNQHFTRSNVTPNTGPTRILAGNEKNKVDLNFDTVKLVFEES